jgi:hypothetical protein
MNYSVMDECMQALFKQYIPLSQAQRDRLSQICASVLLAGSCQLPKLARWLGRDAKQPYREQWLRRLLHAPFLSQEYVYLPWLKQALQDYRPACWHLEPVMHFLNGDCYTQGYEQKIIPHRCK